MLSITSREALERASRGRLTPDVCGVLADRIDQLGSEFDLSEMARFVVVEPGDTIPELEAELGFSPFVNAVDGKRFGRPGFEPSWEWILDHGFCFEVVFVFSDSGFGEVLIVAKGEGQIPDLLALFETFRDFSSADC